MAVGQFPFPNIKPLPGLRLGVACAGIRYKNRNDMLLLELAEGSNVAGIFTQNDFCAAPVILAREHLRVSGGNIRYLIINAGNANACTGDQGLASARTLCKNLADNRGIGVEQVLPFSTGVIGEHLPLEKMKNALPHLLEALDESAWLAAAKTIMTTDTRPKGATVEFVRDGETIAVSGIAKGVGMIKPNMATMLAFVATNAKISAPILKTLVKDVGQESFNRIVVDGDTSTNDASMLIATGQTLLPEINAASGELYSKLKDAILEVSMQLARNLVCDGEGATKFVSVEVIKGKNKSECGKVAYAVAQSPLVKTAFFASDPNWGRIAAAVGNAGLEALDPHRVNIWLGDVLIVENGQRAVSYTEAAGQQVMNQENIPVTIDLGRGEASHTVWTTDFSHDYVTINAEYRT